MNPSEARVYVGGRDGHIDVFTLERSTGALTLASRADAGDYPSFLAFSPDGRFVYAVNEASDHLASFSAHARTGALSPVNRVPCPGGPCYVATDRTGRFVFTASYGGGLIHVFRRLHDGSLGPCVQSIASGANAHAIVPTDANRVVLVPCLGTDRVVLYRFDPESGTLHPGDPPFVSAPKGAGPRHVALSPDGRHAYVIHELDSTLAVHTFAEASGAMVLLQVVSTLPPGFGGANSGADVHLAPSGRFVYASNRGHDSIAIYETKADGRVVLVGHEPTGGKTPRNFAIDPAGAFLVVANQDSDSLVVFRIDAERGTLSRLAMTERGGCPQWVGFAPPIIEPILPSSTAPASRR